MFVPCMQRPIYFCVHLELTTWSLLHTYIRVVQLFPSVRTRILFRLTQWPRNLPRYCMYVCTYVRIYVRTHTRTHVHAYTYVCTYVCLFVCMYVCNRSMPYNKILRHPISNESCPPSFHLVDHILPSLCLRLLSILVLVSLYSFFQYVSNLKSGMPSGIHNRRHTLWDKSCFIRT
jgi:hypothetical protein